MKENYIVKLKNGEVMAITEEQKAKISGILTMGETPEFIKIDGNIIKTDYIAYVKKEAW